MNVKELIELLNSVEDKDRLVIIQKDSEGNNFSPFENIWTGTYEPYTSWSGRVGLDELTEEDIKEGFTEDDIIDNGTKALFLYPIN